MKNSNAWMQRPRGSLLVIILLCWLSLLHLSGIYLFARGFLLNRLSLLNVSECTDGDCTELQTHRRLVLLVIDALRFDFVAQDPVQEPSPYHHNILTLPQQLSAEFPSHSFLFNAYADPPTSTMQRIKGIMTGSLPTFIDITANFGGTSIEEDSIINQLDREGRKIAFMGDDTWMTVFPTRFTAGMTFPFDSFNVEDLHSVDEGVIRHIFPLLEGHPNDWDVIIGHFLGVDHVGHRVGPDHPTMAAKLRQMDNVLRRIVDLLDDDTLLVVLGDHGMDRRGDHGGDGELETSSGVWLYSKGPPLAATTKSPIAHDLLPNTTFPGAASSHRWIQQIDLVPTISLLLGLPIPFNNLGTVIPELFARSKYARELRRAMQLNSNQINRFLDAYRRSSSGPDLDNVWDGLLAARSAATLEDDDDNTDLFAHYFYNRTVLQACRSLWAQFNVLLMAYGIVVLGVGLLTSAILYSRLGRVVDWEGWASKKIPRVAKHAGTGAAAGLILHLGTSSILTGVTAFETCLFMSSLASCGALLLDTFPTIPMPNVSSLPIILILHALSFMSNSFTFWEDRIMTFFLVSSTIPAVQAGITAPTNRLRNRILMYSALFAVCVRLIGISTVCREEQQPYCHVTFYASSSIAAPPLVVILFAIPVSLALPYVIRAFLSISGADKGLASSFLLYILHPALAASSVCWLLEWAETSEIGDADLTGIFRIGRTIIARCTLGGTIFGAGLLWWNDPLCVDIRISANATPGGENKRQVTVLGFTNAYGAPFLLFWCIALSIVYLMMQLTGQIVLALSVTAMLAHLEVTDAVRDVQAMSIAFASATPSSAFDLEKVKIPSVQFSFSQASVFAMLAIQTFHGTGHQATLQSLQWKAAFLLTPKLTYPFSPLLVLINTLGSHFLLALASPLLALWQFAPLPQPQSERQALRGTLRSALSIMLYFSTLLLGSAVSSAWLRRHLMVWKVFAPRFMASAVGLLMIDFAVLMAVCLGVHRTVEVVALVFKKIS